MGFSQNSCPDTNFNQRSHFGTECRRQMLKDFLSDESGSYSSSGFQLFPRKPSDSSIRTLVEIDLDVANSSNAGKLLRSRSRAAASTTISAFQALINAVKNISFTAAKPPSILPRIVSRRLSKTTRRKHCCENKKDGETKITVVKVKDIIRWKSFRDLVEETSPPLDFVSPPNHCTADTVTVATATTGSPTTSTTTARSSSNGSSWCDSDFTSEFLPCWNGNSAESEVEAVALAVVGKTLFPCVGEDSTEPTKTKTTHTEVGPNEVEEKQQQQQQHSPVSAIEYDQAEEWGEEPSLSSFDRSLENVERTKENLMERIRKFENLAELDPVNIDEWMSSVSDNTCSKEESVDDEREEEEEACNEVEEKAWQLLNHINATRSLETIGCRNNADQLLLDFFIDELMIFSRACQNGIKEDIEKMLINKVKGWIDGDESLLIEWELEHKREAYVKDMDRDSDWRNCRAEKEELTLAIEEEILGLLVEELFSCDLSLQR